MPFKSNAHRQKIQELVKAGKVSAQEYNRLDKETGNARLPERVGEPTGPRVSTSEPYSGPKVQRFAKMIRPGSRTAPSTRKRLRRQRSHR
jgi:hypothetical protein